MIVSMSFCYKISDAVIFDIFDDVFFHNRRSKIFKAAVFGLWQPVSGREVVRID